MEQKIAELTGKIYKEGVEKGEAEAKKIVDAAQEKADKLITDARAEAKKIAEDAQAQADELKRNAASEIKLSGQQAVSSIKQQIVDLIMAKAVDETVSASLNNTDTVKELIVEVVKNWQSAHGDSLEVLLPESKKDELEKALHGSIQKQFKSGVSLNFSKSVKGGFQIGPENSTFKISLTDEDFSEFFKEYLRPKTRSYLFGD